MSKNRTVKQALEHYAANPVLPEDVIDVPIHTLIARSLFAFANNPNPKVKGANARANRAQKILLERMVGRRNPGTSPASSAEEVLEFADLSAGAIGDAS